MMFVILEFMDQQSPVKYDNITAFESYNCMTKFWSTMPVLL